MHIVIALVVGGFCGWLASVLMKTRRVGILGAVVLGILGSLLGGWLFGLLGFTAWGLPAQIIVNVVGAMALIAVLRAARLIR